MEVDEAARLAGTGHHRRRRDPPVADARRTKRQDVGEELLQRLVAQDRWVVELGQAGRARGVGG